MAVKLNTNITNEVQNQNCAVKVQNDDKDLQSSACYAASA